MNSALPNSVFTCFSSFIITFSSYTHCYGQQYNARVYTSSVTEYCLDDGLEMNKKKNKNGENSVICAA